MFLLKRFLKSHFVQAIIVIACFVFIALSSGGDFLHNKIHHHTTQSSHDNCSLSVLQSSAALINSFVVIFFCAFIYLRSTAQSFVVFNPYLFLHSPRGPPAIV